MVIDIHTHVGNCVTGGGIDSPYQKPPRLLSDLFEISNFRLLPGRKMSPRFSRYVEVIHNQERANLATAENLLRYMDRFEVDASVLLPIEPLCTVPDGRVGDGRLLSFASVDVRRKSWRGDLEEQMKKGCLGLKVHPILQNLPPWGGGVRDLLEEYSRYDRPVMIHAGESCYRVVPSARTRFGRVSDWVPVFDAFPGLCFIIAHMAMEGWKSAIEIGERVGNIYTDTSFQPVSHVREALRRLGGERVLFASDWPFSLQRAPLRVASAATRGDKGLESALLFGNAARLLELDL